MVAKCTPCHTIDFRVFATVGFGCASNGVVRDKAQRHRGEFSVVRPKRPYRHCHRHLSLFRIDWNGQQSCKRPLPAPTHQPQTPNAPIEIDPSGSGGAPPSNALATGPAARGGHGPGPSNQALSALSGPFIGRPGTRAPAGHARAGWGLLAHLNPSSCQSQRNPTHLADDDAQDWASGSQTRALIWISVRGCG